MKTFLSICLGLVLMVVLAGRSYADAPKPPAAKIVAPVAPPHSTFTQPTGPREGRDPFFPESTRVFESNVAVTSASQSATTLAVKGFSIVGGRPMVIINNHTFMSGDEGDVLSAGARVHVRCLEIRAGTVVVEVNGARREIHF